jgi:hypothetical protein
MLIASVFVMSSFVYADNPIELEFGNEALEEYMTYTLEEGLEYEVADDEIIEVIDNTLIAKRFGDSILYVKENNTILKEIEVIVYFVGNELTPFSAITVNKPYLSGYPDGTFKPKNFITRAELSCILEELITLDQITSKEYPDLLNTHWSYGLMNQAFEYGFLKPIGDEAYPDGYVTRLEIAEFVESYINYKQLELDPMDHQEIVDTDLSGPQLCVATNLMILEDGKFIPDGFIRREEVVKIINKITSRNLETEAPNQFSDVLITDIYYRDIHASTK